MIATDVFHDQAVLHGQRVRLEPMCGRHFDGLWPMFSEPESTRLTGTHRTFTETEIRQYLATRAEATRLVVDYAFDVAGLHRVSLEVYDFNPRAQRVYEKCGFRREGIHRDALLWDGQRHGAICMSLLRTDPRPPQAMPTD